MDIRRKRRSIVTRLQNTEDPAKIRKILDEGMHIIPISVIEKIFKKIPLDSLVRLAPYLSPRVCRQLDLQSTVIPSPLRPLIYNRPARELWCIPDLVYHTVDVRAQYAMWLVARRFFPAAVKARDANFIRRTIMQVSVTQINKLLRMAFTDDAIRQIVANNVLPQVCCVASSKLIVALLKEFPEMLNYQLAGACITNHVTTHYRVAKHILSVCMRNQALMDELLDPYREAALAYSGEPYRIMALGYGGFPYRLSSRMRVWLVEYAHRKWGAGKIPWMDKKQFFTRREWAKTRRWDVGKKLQSL